MSIICGVRKTLNLRPITITSLFLATNSYCTSSREARFLKKLMIGTSKSRRKWFNVDQTPSKALKEFNFMGGKIIPAEQRQKSGKVTRRVGVLNTVFLEQITSLLATGDAGIDIFGLGLEISRVEISSDFDWLTIYWYTNGTERDDVLASTLEKVGFSLRHQLTQLRIIGYVPPIRFAMDAEYSKLLEVEKLLQVADYGEDFTATDIGRQMKAPLPTIPSSALPKELRAKIEEFETSRSVSEDEGDDLSTDDSDAEGNDYDPNVMRQDILGFRHDVIMEKVVEAVNRLNQRKNPQSSQANLNQEILVTGEAALLEMQNNKLRTLEFLQFLKTRRIAKAKEYKRLSAEFKEREFYESEMIERKLISIEQSILDEESDIQIPVDDKDFILEEIEEEEECLRNRLL